jgi:hypothetical protein
LFDLNQGQQLTAALSDWWMKSSMIQWADSHLRSIAGFFTSHHESIIALGSVMMIDWLIILFSSRLRYFKTQNRLFVYLDSVNTLARRVSRFG